MASGSKGRIRVLVPHTFVPPEARGIAESFRAEARRVREYAQRLKGVSGTLDLTWEGHSKNNFMTEFTPEPSKLESFASWLDDRARHIEQIQVTEWREEWRDG